MHRAEQGRSCWTEANLNTEHLHAFGAIANSRPSSWQRWISPIHFSIVNEGRMRCKHDYPVFPPVSLPHIINDFTYYILGRSTAEMRPLKNGNPASPRLATVKV